MPEENSILLIKDYGHIKIKLKKLLDDRGMTRNYLARAINSRFEVVDKWYQNCVDKIDADILARMCYVLKCGVDDIIEYVEK